MHNILVLWMLVKLLMVKWLFFIGNNLVIGFTFCKLNLKIYE